MRRKRGEGIERRLLVRAPGDIWSDEFREEVRRDRRFEESLLPLQLAVWTLVVLLIAVHLVIIG